MEEYILCVSLFFARLHSFILITTLYFFLGSWVMEETDASGIAGLHTSHKVSSFSGCLGQGLKDLTLLKSAGTHL